MRGCFREALSAGEYVASWCWFVLVSCDALVGWWLCVVWLVAHV
nr:MAG TPA: hypothetical protein [Caudoviricetes sp.]